MRKPLVAISVAAVLLGAGGIAATTAGAEESPPFPDVPGFSLPDFGGWADSADDGDDASTDDAATTMPDVPVDAADGSRDGGRVPSSAADPQRPADPPTA